MEHVIVGTAAFLVATLSVFTGFGLGTVLLPVFAIFFSAGLAVGATALVHGAANVLKVALLGRHADRQVVVRFGLLSGHQGALRSAFLAKLKITTQTFAGTAAVVSLLVDLARIAVYGAAFLGAGSAVLDGDAGRLVATATGAAFVGVLVGRSFVRKVPMRAVQTATGLLLLAVAGALALGLV